MNKDDNMVEEWKSIEGFEGAYEISNLGRLKSFKKNKDGLVLQNNNSKGGYFAVILRFKEKKITTRIHRLVALHFIKNDCIDKKHVNHIDGNKQNNVVSNLEWVTCRENSAHALSMYTNKITEYSQNNSSGFIKKECTSKYIGVFKVKTTGKWHSYINHLGKSIFLGSFLTEYDAHLAYEDALKAIKENKILVVNNENILRVRKAYSSNYVKKTRKYSDSKYIRSNSINPLIQLSLNGEYIKEFDSATKAFLETGVCARNISQVASKEVYKVNAEGKSLTRKQAGGFVWKYKEDYEVNGSR